MQHLKINLKTRLEREPWYILVENRAVYWYLLMISYVVFCLLWYLAVMVHHLSSHQIIQRWTQMSIYWPRTATLHVPTHTICLTPDYQLSPTWWGRLLHLRSSNVRHFNIEDDKKIRRIRMNQWHNSWRLSIKV